MMCRYVSWSREVEADLGKLALRDENRGCDDDRRRGAEPKKPLSSDEMATAIVDSMSCGIETGAGQEVPARSVKYCSLPVRRDRQLMQLVSAH